MGLEGCLPSVILRPLDTCAAFNGTPFNRAVILHKISNMKYSSLLFIFFLLSISNCNQINESNIQIDNKYKINQFVKNIVDQYQIPGVSLSVIKDNAIYHKNAFGSMNIDNHQPLKTSDFFHFASVSKPFVATAIIQLVEEKKINLEDKVADILPYFSMNDERYKEITIRQILSHTSGIGDVWDYEWDKPQYDEQAAERFVRSLKDEKLRFAPNSDWAYSNMGFDILGDVIQKISGEPFESYIKRKIFTPLKMENSSFIYTEIPENLRTTPHTWKGEKVVSEIYPYNRIHAPSSTLNSSVEEVSNWAICNLNKGTFENKQIFSEKSHHLLWTNVKSFDDKPTVGLSWFLGKHKENKKVWHSGGDTGYRSFLVMLPEANIAVIVASNFELSPVDGIANGILDIMLGYEPDQVKLHIGIPFVETFNKQGYQAAKLFYEEIASDTLKSKNYIMGTDGLTQIAYYADYLGLKEESSILFQYNLELNPNSADANNGLGQILIKQNKLEEAESYFKAALEIDSSNEYSKEKLIEINNLKKD